MSKFQVAKQKLKELASYQTIGTDNSLSEADYTKLGGKGTRLAVEVIDVFDEPIKDQTEKGLKWKIILFPAIVSANGHSVETKVRATSDQQALSILEELEKRGSNVQTSGKVDKPYSTKAKPDVLRYGCYLTDESTNKAQAEQEEKAEKED